MRRFWYLGGVVALVVGVGVAATYASAHGGASLVPTALAATRHAPEPGGPEGHGHKKHGPGGPGGTITLTAIDGNTMTEQTANGWTKRVQVNAQTQYKRGGQTFQLSDLRVGDQVRIRDERQTDGSYLALEVRVELPKVDGGVSAITNGDLTIHTPRGDVTVHTNGQTAFKRAGQPAQLGDVRVGSRVHVEGMKNADGSVTAALVDIHLPRVHGQVTAKSTDTITVQDEGQSRTVSLDANTIVELAPGRTGSLNDIGVGANVDAEGTIGSDGTMTAVKIHVRLPHVRGQVTATTSDALTIVDRGQTKTVRVDANTIVELGPGRTGSLNDIAVGSAIDAEGTIGTDGTMTAVVIHVRPTPPR